MQGNALETTQIAAQLAGTIQALAAETAEHSSNTAMDVTGLALTNASTKALAALAQLNVLVTAIKPVPQAANGKTPEQIQTMTGKIYNAATRYVITAQMFMTIQEPLKKMHAQTALITIVI